MNLIEQAKKLEEAIQQASSNCDCDNIDILNLIQIASESSAIMKVMGNFNLKEMMYEMVILSSQAGWTPDSFKNKSKGK